MKSRDTLLQLLRQEKENLMRRWPIVRLALFGSVARDEAGPASDVDILVEFNGKMGLKFMTLAHELEDLLQEKVDLVSWKAIRPEAWPYIESDILNI